MFTNRHTVPDVDSFYVFTQWANQKQFCFQEKNLFVTIRYLTDFLRRNNYFNKY